MKKLSKKVLTVLLALVLVVAVATVAVLAAEGSTEPTYEKDHGWADVAKGQEAKYVISDDKSTITLNDDITITGFIQLKSGSLTVNLNNHKIERATGEGGTVFSVKDVTLTVKNGTLTSDGNRGDFIIAENSKITLDKVIMNNGTKSTGSLIAASNGTKVTLNDTTITSSSSKYVINIGAIDGATSGGTLEINGNTTITSTSTTKDYIAVLVGKESTMTMNGGKITAAVKAVQVQDKSTFNLKGGTIDRTAGQDEAHAEAAVTVITGATLNMSDGTISGVENAIDVQCGKTSDSGPDGDAATVTVTGGKLVSTGTAPTVSVTDKSSFTMTGGTIEAAGAALSVGVTAEKFDSASEKDKAFATIGGNTIINCKKVENVDGINVQSYGDLTIKGNAQINGGIGVFKYSALTVTDDSTVTNISGFGISTNGSKGDSANTSIGANITVNGNAIVKGADDACGIYLPAGTLNVSGKAQISGGAGIVARGGTANIDGGTITATATEPVTVGDAKGASGERYAVPPAAFVMDNASYPTEDSAKTTITDGKFEAANGKDAVVRTEKGEKKTDGNTNNNTKLDVKGGSFSGPVEEAYLDKTMNVMLKGKDGTYSYYASEVDALNSGIAIDELTLTTAGKSNASIKKITVEDNTVKVTFDVPETAATSKYYILTEKITETANGETVRELGIPTDNNSTVVTAGLNTISFAATKLAGGNYRIVLKSTSVDTATKGTEVSSAELTLYKITYKPSTGVTGSESVFYTDDAVELEARKEMAPASVTLNADVNKWTFGCQKTDDYNFTVSVGGVYASPIDPGHTCPIKGFKDMTIYDTGKLWYHEAMDYMVLNGYIQGFPGNTLQPDGIATRAQLWVIMAQVKGVDVKSDPWYKLAKKWAEENKYSDGLRPNDPIQREEIVKILWSIAGQPKPTKSLSDYKFGDAASVNDWAKTAMAWAIENGIMAGRGSNLVPQGIATRAELARFIYSYVTLMK